MSFTPSIRAPRRIALLRRLRVERRARGSRSSVMASSHEVGEGRVGNTNGKRPLAHKRYWVRGHCDLSRRGSITGLVPRRCWGSAMSWGSNGSPPGVLRRLELNGFHNAVEWDLCPHTLSVDHRSRWALEQEQGQAVGRYQDAADGSDGVVGSSRVWRRLRGSDERGPHLVLRDPWPIALDHEDSRWSSSQATQGRASGAIGEDPGVAP